MNHSAGPWMTTPAVTGDFHQVYDSEDKLIALVGGKTEEGRGNLALVKHAPAMYHHLKLMQTVLNTLPNQKFLNGLNTYAVASQLDQLLKSIEE